VTSAVAQRRGSYIDRPSPSSLADVVELILDKGLVIDAYVRVSLVGIEILTIDARIVIASVDTYLRFAEATNRLDLYQHGGKDLGELTESLSEGGSKGKTKGALDGAKDKVSELIGGSDDDDDSDDGGSGGESSSRRRPSRSRQSASRRRSSRQEDDGE
jgi:hypothetical protein